MTGFHCVSHLFFLKSRMQSRYIQSLVNALNIRFCTSLAPPRPSPVYFVSLNDDACSVIFNRQNVLQLCNFLLRQGEKIHNKSVQRTRKMSLLRICCTSTKGFVKRGLFLESTFTGECKRNTFDWGLTYLHNMY